MQTTSSDMSIYLTRMLLLLLERLPTGSTTMMALSKLNLNPDKTEFIVFGSKVLRQKLSFHFPVNILGSLPQLADIVKNLGVLFEANFFFSEHVKKTCKACFLQMCDLLKIRLHLTQDVAVLAEKCLV